MLEVVSAVERTGPDMDRHSCLADQLRLGNYRTHTNDIREK